MKYNRYIFVTLENDVEVISNEIVYVIDSDQIIKFRCPCGCNEIIQLSMVDGNVPKWKVINYNTISPSINRIVGCRSHFSIILGTVVED